MLPTAIGQGLGVDPRPFRRVQVPRKRTSGAWLGLFGPGFWEIRPASVIGSKGIRSGLCSAGCGPEFLAQFPAPGQQATQSPEQSHREQFQAPGQTGPNPKGPGSSGHAEEAAEKDLSHP